MALTLITAPTVQPVSLATVKMQSRIDAAAEDSLLSIYIDAAVSNGQNLTQRQFVEATYERVLNAFPASGEIELPRPPLQSVTSIKYLDSAGDEQTLSTDVYDVDTDSEPGRALLAYNQSWPTTQAVKRAVRVRYVTGYPLSEGSPTTPEAIQSWLLLRVAGLYEQRESIVFGAGTIAANMPRDFADALLDAYTIVSV